MSDDGERVPGGVIYRKVKHVCPKPDASAYEKGDRFHCDCGLRWVVGEDYYDAKVWDRDESPESRGTE